MICGIAYLLDLIYLMFKAYSELRSMPYFGKLFEYLLIEITQYQYLFGPRSRFLFLYQPFNVYRSPPKIPNWLDAYRNEN